MKTILITGINGFLGSNLARTLASEYHIIGLEYSLKDLFRIKDQDYTVYSAENGIPDRLFKDRPIDIVIHTSTCYGRQNETVKTIADANLFLPFELLDHSIKNGCSLFVNTDSVLDRFVNVYALTKRHFQEWLYIRRNEMKIINMQLEHFYGPGSSKANFITAMIERLRLNEPAIDLTPGEQQRDFVYIDDVVSAYMIVLKNFQELSGNYNEFHVATGQLTSIRQLLETLKNIIGSSSLLKFGAIPYRENELMYSESDNFGLISLGWFPKFSITEGLRLTLGSSV